MRTIVIAALALLLGAVPSSAALALEERTGTTAQVAAGETINDDVALFGESLTVAGHVTGDVYAFGRTVSVSGKVDGDVFAGAQTILVDGTVGGSLRGAASALNLQGTVGRNLMGLAQQVTVGQEASVGGNSLIAAQSASLLGTLAGNLGVGADTLQITGQVGGNVESNVRSLQIAPTARIGGKLRYESPVQAEIPSGTVAGEVSYVPRAARPVRQPEPLNGALNWFNLAMLAGGIVVGLILLRLFPAASTRFVAELRRQPLPAFVWGLVALIATPVALLLAALTLVGLPLALLSFGGYLAGLYIGWILLALLVGTLLVELGRPRRAIASGWLLALGLVVLYIVTRVPVAGGIIAFVGACLGLGGLLLALNGLRRGEPPPPAPAVEQAAR